MHSEDDPKASQPAGPAAANQLLENPFPAEHTHLHEWLQEAEAQLQALDHELNKSRGPGLHLNPPTFSEPPRPVGRSWEFIQQEKDRLKASVYQRVEKETEKAPRQTKQASRDIAFGRLYKEEIAKATPTNRLPPPSVHWNMNDAQIQVMAKARDFRERANAQPDRATPGRATPNPAAPDSNQPTRATAEPATADRAQPARAEPVGQTISRPEWTAVPPPAATPPVAEAPAPAVDAPTPLPVETPAEPPTEPIAVETSVEPVGRDAPDWEPER